MKKLSEQLLEMSKRTAGWEDQVATRRAEDHQVIEADVAEAQKSAQAAQAAFAATLDSIHDSQTSHWHEVQESFNKQVAAARSRAAATKASIDLSAAKRGADLDEAYAQAASEFAQMAAAEANAAMVGAAQSRAYARSLEKAPDKTTA